MTVYWLRVKFYASRHEARLEAASSGERERLKIAVTPFCEILEEGESDR